MDGMSHRPVSHQGSGVRGTSVPHDGTSKDFSRSVDESRARNNAGRDGQARQQAPGCSADHVMASGWRSASGSVCWPSARSARCCADLIVRLASALVRPAARAASTSASSASVCPASMIRLAAQNRPLLRLPHAERRPMRLSARDRRADRPGASHAAHGPAADPATAWPGPSRTQRRWPGGCLRLRAGAPTIDGGART